jgi:hypothetical protein
MLITILLIFIFFVIISILLRNSLGKKRFPGPKPLISPPKILFDGILKLPNKSLQKFLLNLLYPESARYIASQYYTSKYGDIVQINLFNQPTIIISNSDFADYILRRNGKNYTLRFGNKLGLEYLGMGNKGIIWNRNIQRSNFFQKALNSKILDDAKYVSNDAADYVLKSNRI